MDSLYSVCWNITSNCNENCKFCFRKKCNENTLEENKKIFDNLSKIKIHKLTFSGGEALLYKDLFDLADYIKEKNPSLILSLTSNGKIINDKIMKKIIEKFDIITFPIDSSDDDINEKIGRGKNHLAKVKKLLDICNNKIKIKINTVANNYNIEDLENIYKLIEKYNISRWKILRYYPIRDSVKYKEEFYIDDKISNIVEKIINNIRNENNIVINYDNEKEFKTSYFIIYPDGSVENNQLQDVGNLLHTPITEILNLKEEELVNNFSKDIFNKSKGSGSNGFRRNK